MQISPFTKIDIPCEECNGTRYKPEILDVEYKGKNIQKMLNILDKLVDQGNTVLIIEHNIDILSYADYLIELGPEGGPKGGKIIAMGTPEEVKMNKQSKTAPFLA